LNPCLLSFLNSKELVGGYWKRSGARFASPVLIPQINKKACWWLLARCSPLPIPNREVKPGTADDTWIKPGKVGSRHNTIIIHAKSPSCKGRAFFVPKSPVVLTSSYSEQAFRPASPGLRVPEYASRNREVKY
jgi:hypothetical protein